MVSRQDTGTLVETPQRLDNGYLQVGCYPSRTGVFTYRNADGSLRREYRPEDEVFHTDSLATFRGIAVTDDHPPQMLTSKNTRDFQVGTVIGDSIGRQDNLITANLLLTDDEAIEKVLAGKQEVSCGYTCDLDETPGVSPDGVPYDAVQRRIRLNHLAIVHRGRAGAQARIKFDAIEEPGYTQPVGPVGGIMTKVLIGKVEYEASEQLAAALSQHMDASSAELAKLTEQVKALSAERDTAQAKFDAAQDEVKGLKTRLDSVDVNALVSERIELMEAARRVAPEIKLDSLSNDEIVKQVVAAKVKVEGEKSPEYLRARFDALVEAAAETAARSAAGTVSSRNDAAPVSKAEAARRKFIEDSDKLCRGGE